MDPTHQRRFIIAALRAATRRWPPKYNTLNAAKTKKKKNALTGRLAQHYRCNACKNDFPLKQVQVDHIVPAVDPATGFTNWDEYISRLFCDENNLQVLCKACHNIKTQGERSSTLKKVSKQKKASLLSKALSRKKKPTM